MHTYGVRVISVTEGIDTERDSWELLATIVNLIHERFVKGLGEDVFRGQEGALLADYSVGDWCFGFGSEPVPGTEKSRRGRNAKPRMRYVVQDVEASWVLRIFRGFVIDRRSICSIVRELNSRNAPKGSKAKTRKWHHKNVTDILANPKYVGVWPWGERENVRDPETGKITQHFRSEEETEKYTRLRPDLRIIDQEVFDEAQKLLEDNYQRFASIRSSSGRLAGRAKGDNGAPDHLLQGLVQCAQCGSVFYGGGSRHRYRFLFCPNYSVGKCSCKRQLRRDLAEKLVLAEIGKQILQNETWIQAVFEATITAWQRRQQQLPTKLETARRGLADVKAKIERLVDRIEAGIDDPDVRERLRERRGQRRDLVKQLSQLETADQQTGPAPTLDWVHQQVAMLGDTLLGETPAAAYALRDLIDGQIVVELIRLPGRKRKFYRGRFKLKCRQLLEDTTVENSASDSVHANEVALKAKEVVVDFVEQDPADDEADRAKELYDQGLMCLEIGRQLGWAKSKVTKRIRHWFESRGIPMPDGRSRRSQLKRKHLEPPLYVQLSDPAKSLYDDGLLLGEIADQLGCDRNTITHAIAHWFKSCGLPVPDGRTRRKQLGEKSRAKQQLAGKARGAGGSGLERVA